MLFMKNRFVPISFILVVQTFVTEPLAISVFRVFSYWMCIELHDSNNFTCSMEIVKGLGGDEITYGYYILSIRVD